MLIRRMLRERRRTTRLQESRLADIALNIHSLLVLLFPRVSKSPDQPEKEVTKPSRGWRATRYEGEGGMGSHGVETACGCHVVAGLTTFF